MSAKPKIVVLKMKELIYGAIFVGLGLLLVILLMVMFMKPKSNQNTPTGKFTSGVYTSSIILSGQAIDVEVTVDRDHINSIRFVNLSEDIATMFPLMETTLDSLTEQILSQQSLENLRYSEDAKYTTIVLVRAIQDALDKASVDAENTTTAR